MKLFEAMLDFESPVELMAGLPVELESGGAVVLVVPSTDSTTVRVDMFSKLALAPSDLGTASLVLQAIADLTEGMVTVDGHENHPTMSLASS